MVPLVPALLAVVALPLFAIPTTAQIKQSTGNFSEDVPLWELSPNDTVSYGCSLFLSSYGEEEVLLKLSAGDMRRLNPKTGNIEWTFDSKSIDNTVSWDGSGVFFSPFAPVPYVVYCATSFTGGEVAVTFRNILIGVSLETGSELFRTGIDRGECVGTPVTTADGKYVLITRTTELVECNPDDPISPFFTTFGYFSVYDTTNPQDPVYSYNYPMQNASFGAIGHYWNPIQGYFDGGYSNPNDVFIWCLNPIDMSEANNATMVGQMFAFQMPVVPGSAFNVTLVGGERNFVSHLPPIITNGGLSMYWPVSRTKLRVWVGEKDVQSRDFSSNGVANVDFVDWEPEMGFGEVSPTLSDASATPFVIGLAVPNLLFRMSTDYSTTRIDTAVDVTSRVIISRDGARAYFRTESGSIHCVDSTSLEEFWNITIPEGFYGKMALSLNGDILYTADNVGVVRAYNVSYASVFVNTTNFSSPASSSSDCGLNGLHLLPLLALLPIAAVM